MLDIRDVQKLKIIEKNFSTDVEKCADKMLDLWLETKSNASWNKLIRAFREPHIKLEKLASDIEGMLCKGILM